MPRTQIRPATRPNHAGQPTGWRGRIVWILVALALAVLGANFFINWDGLFLDDLPEVTDSIDDAATPFARGVAFYNGEVVPQDKAQAAVWFRKAAEQGDADAQYRLGCMYADGDGLPQDTAQAQEWLHKAAEQGAFEAWDRLSVMYNAGQLQPRGREMSRDWLRMVIQRKKAKEYYESGIRSYTGEGARKDVENGVRLLRKAANLGHEEALSTLKKEAELRADREVLKADIRAAQAGEAEAQDCLASRYYRGKGVPVDKKKALFWFRKAAEQGLVGTQCFLGYLYYEGHEIAQDREQAFFWFSKAAEQGNPTAQYYLGRMYSEGDHVGADMSRALDLCRKAAEQGYLNALDWLGGAALDGNVEALFILGELYENGKEKEEFVERDLKRAALKMAERYVKGNGVKKDAVQAYAYLLLHTTFCNGEAPTAETKNLKAALERQLTPEQQDEARQKLAALKEQARQPKR